MLPNTCKGCPYYKPDSTFVPDEMNDQAEAHFILLSPTPLATRLGKPDLGDLQKGIRLSGIQEWSAGYMLRCHVPGKPKGNSIAWEAKVQKAAQHCAQYTKLPDRPIVTIGKDVFKFYSGDKGDAYLWRGFRTDIEVED